MRKKAILLCLFGIACLFGCLAACSVQEDADSQFSFESIREKCEEMTQSDDLEDSDSLPQKTVGEYIAAVREGKVGTDSEQSEVLYHIIPAELFRNEGSRFYQGEAYSFYVDTSRSGNKYVSDVVIIDHNMSFEEMPFDETTGISTTDIVMCARKYSTKKEKDQWLTKESGNAKKKYFLYDLKMFVTAESEHEPGFCENMYEGDDDFLFWQEFTVSGLYLRGDGAEKVSQGDFLTSYGVTSYAETAEKRREEFPLQQSVFQTRLSDYRSTEIQCGEGEKQSYYVSGMAAEICPANIGSSVLVSDSARAVTYISDEGHEVRVTSRIGYFFLIEQEDEWIIVNGENDWQTASSEAFAVCFEKDFLFSDEQTKAEDGENSGYLLREDSVQKFSFIPQRNSDYIVSAGEGKLVRVGREVSGEYSDWAASQTYRFLTIESYSIEVKKEPGEGETDRFYTLNIDFSPAHFNVGKNVVQFTDTRDEFLSLTEFSEDYYYRFRCADERVFLRITDDTFSAAYATGNDFRVRLYKISAPYYLELVCDTSWTGAVEVICSRERDVTFYTSIASNPEIKLTICEGEEVVMPVLDSAPTGMKFAGWWEIGDDGSERLITKENIWSIEMAQFALYAKWEPNMTVS